MSNNRPIPNAIGQDEPPANTEDREKVYFAGSPALRGSLLHLLISFVIGVGFIAGAVVLHAYGWWIPPLGLLIAVAIVTTPVLLIRSIRYRITNYRIDYERGVFSKDINTLELWHVEDIQYHQSLLDRLFNIGQITVISHDEATPTLLLKALPNPRPVFDALKDQIIAVKRQRGVIKMDPG